MPSGPPPLALAFHGIAILPYREDPHRLFVSPAAVERHVRWLRAHGYRLVDFGELAQRAADGVAEGHAALTFDDGLGDNLHRLSPLLADLRVPATVFVVTDWIGGDHPDAPDAPMLTTDELRRLHLDGIAIGAHTHTHRRLVELADDEVLSEWATCRAVLEEVIDDPVTIGAYPYGEADPRVRSLTGAAGLTACCHTSGEGSWDDALGLPRQAVSHGSSTGSLRLKRRGWYEPVNRLPGASRIRRLSRRHQSRRDARPPGRARHTSARR